MLEPVRTNASGIRAVSRVVRGRATSDGAGVELTRVIGTGELPMLDPFLMLDVFRSNDPDDYIAGFPPHPHRGFETVTYLLDGRMRHRDSTGREGIIEPGGIQWMTAGRGIVHSEMPEQENGLLAGFQLWVNLPASHKMDPPAYQEHAAAAIPVERSDDGAEVRVIVGRTSRGTAGPVSQPLTDPLYLDVSLPPGVAWSEPVAAGHNAFVFVFEGEALLPGAAGEEARVPSDHLAVLAGGERAAARAGAQGARFLLVSGRPLNEPVARGGPFVMNTQAEVRQAFEDYSAGRF
jgi:redox-sensitive bicupin YhaK (pirin superfamily)